jgi:hypothetical protein
MQVLIMALNAAEDGTELALSPHVIDEHHAHGLVSCRTSSKIIWDKTDSRINRASSNSRATIVR